MLSDVPVAVLVIDQLAGNVGLPMPVDSWGAAVGLTG